MARYEAYNQTQMLLIPLDVDINIPEGSFPRFLNDFFEESVDTKAFDDKRKNDFTGAPAKHCRMMLKVLFYAFSQGVYSMRELSEKFLTRHIDYIYLSGNQHVDHSTFSRFIQLYEQEIIEVFARTVYVANHLKYIGKDLMAIDSTPLQGNASINFMGDRKLFEKKKKTLEKMIQNLLTRSQRLDAEENSLIAEKCAKERKNIVRLKKDYENMLKRINTFLNEPSEKDEKTKEGKVKQVNLIDRDSRLLRKRDHEYIQGYKCQVGMSETGVIVSTEVGGSEPDHVLLRKMVKKSEAILKEVGKPADEIKKMGFLSDKGYINAEEIGKLCQEGYDLYLPVSVYEQSIDDAKKISVKHCKIYKKEGERWLQCPGGEQIPCMKTVRRKRGYNYYEFRAPDKARCLKCFHYEKCCKGAKKYKSFSVASAIFDNLENLKQIQKKMSTLSGIHKYNKRFWMGEHGFGIIKVHRKFRKFLVRGLKEVTEQWHMVCAAFNLRKIWRLNQLRLE